MRVLYISFIFIFFLHCVAFCTDLKEKDAIFKIIKKGVKFYETKDTKKLMGLWSKKSPYYKKAKDELLKNLRELEDIKVTLFEKSFKLTPEKDGVVAFVKSKSKFKYIIRVPYEEDGDKISFSLKRYNGEWKITRAKIMKKKKVKQKSEQTKVWAKKKVEQKFSSDIEKYIFNLSKDALNCISKRDIKCFLKYNDCSSPFGYIRCRFMKIWFKIVRRSMMEEDIRIVFDESKKVKIKVVKDRAHVLFPVKTTGKYRIPIAISQRQKMTVFFRKEDGIWKIWKWENVVEDGSKK